MVTKTYTVSTFQQLDDAIKDINKLGSSGSGSTFTIDVARGATLLESANLTAIVAGKGNSVVINGQGSTIDGGGVHTIFHIRSGAVDIDGLAINNGYLRGAGGRFPADAAGAGMKIDSGASVELSNVSFSNNVVIGGQSGARSEGADGSGGALFAAPNSNVTLSNVSFSGNRADGGAAGWNGNGYGGNIFFGGSNLTYIGGTLGPATVWSGRGEGVDYISDVLHLAGSSSTTRLGAAGTTLTVDGDIRIAKGTNATINIDGGTVNFNGDLVPYRYGNSETRMIVNAGTLSIGGEVESHIDVKSGASLIVSGSGSARDVSVHGGALSSTGEVGRLELSGGTATVSDGASYVKVSDGTFSGTGSYFGNANISGGTATIESNFMGNVAVTGGTFNGTILYLRDVSVSGGAASVTVAGRAGDVTVKGGTFSGIGSFEDIAVSGGLATVKGNAGTVTLGSGGSLSVGNGAGVLQSGNLNLLAGSSLKFDLGAGAAGVGFDQIDVTGTVKLGTALDLSLANSASLPSVFTLIDNDGKDAVTGRFSNYAEGQQIGLGSKTYTISYKGGAGANNVILRSQTEFAVSTFDELAQAVAWINEGTDGSGTAYKITVAAGTSLTETADLQRISLNGSDSLVIDGQGSTLDGDGQHDGFFVTSGNVEFKNFTIEDTLVQGGLGGSNSGGGAGLGGGLFVSTQASVTLSDVYFSGNQAVGGRGNSDNGTSLGGELNGGTTEDGFGKGGDPNSKGAGAAGGFGGGGGGGSTAGGAGGFGGGDGNVGPKSKGAGTSGPGGGGLGAGGNIFVQEGGKLYIKSGTLEAGTVQGGGGGNSGQGLGSSIFIHGNQTIHVGADGAATTISGTIADQTGSGGTGAKAGAGSVAIDGGTVNLDGNNTYTGKTTVNSGTLNVGGDNSKSAADVKGGATLAVTGKAGDVTVQKDGTLISTGTAGDVTLLAGGKATMTGDAGIFTVKSGGMLTLGDGFGTFKSGNLDLQAGSTLKAEYGIVASGMDHDEIDVIGAVKLAGTLDLKQFGGGFGLPAPVFTIIDNDGKDAVVGKFSNYTEGQQVVVGLTNYTFTYKGGDGLNNVALMSNQTDFTVSTADELRTVIGWINQLTNATGKNFTITVAPGSTLLETADMAAIRLMGTGTKADTLVIDGNGATLDGDVTYNGLGIGSGKITLEEFSFADAKTGGSSLFIGGGQTITLTGNSKISGTISDSAGTGGKGLGSVIIDGGQVQLAGDNTYSGLTTVNGGSLTIDGNNSKSAVILKNGATVDVNLQGKSGNVMIEAGSSAKVLGAAHHFVMSGGKADVYGTAKDIVMSGGTFNLYDFDGDGGALGVVGNVYLYGGTFGGNGNAGAIIASSGSTLAPGNGPGILHTGNINLKSGSTLKLDVGGGTAGTTFDQLDVKGTVNLAGKLSLTQASAAALGSDLTIISNDGKDKVSGTFAGLAEGAKVNTGSETYVVSYKAGDGNDVVLKHFQTNFTVSNEGELKHALSRIGQLTDGTGTTFTINVVTGSTLTETANLAAIKLRGTGTKADKLVIHGNNSTLDGDDTYNGFSITSANVSIDGLTITDTKAGGSAIFINNLQTVRIGTAGTTTTIDGDITDPAGMGRTGKGSVEINGGSVEFQGNNTYTGVTTVNAGVLGISGNSTSSPVVVKSGGILAVSGTAGAIGTFTNGSAVVTNTGTVGNIAMLGGTVDVAGKGGNAAVFSGSLNLSGTGEIGNVVIGKGALTGSGTTGDVTANSGSILAPGSGPGILHTGNLNMVSGSTLKLDVGGNTAGTTFDQLDVTGTVKIAGKLELTLASAAVPGADLTIINNDGTEKVTGTFAGLAEGAKVKAGTDTYVITYKGADGNDVVLKHFQTNFIVSTAFELDQAISRIGQLSDGSGTGFTITVTSGSTLTQTADLSAIKLLGTGTKADTLVIHGNGTTLDGAGLFNGFSVKSGEVAIDGLTINNTKTGGNAITINGNESLHFGAGNTTMTVSGTIGDTGTASLEIDGGTVNFDGNNTYVGGADVNAGTLNIGGDSSKMFINVKSGATLGVSASGVADYVVAEAGSTVSVAGKSGSVVASGNVNLTGTAGAIAVKAGGTFTDLGSAGDVTMSGGTSNVYGTAGNVTMSGGNFNLFDSILGSSTPGEVGNVVVSGGTFGGSGTAGSIIVKTGATFTPGNGPGILHTSNLDLQSGSTLNIDFGGSTAGKDFDQLDVNGTVKLGGKLILSSTGTATKGATFTLIDNDGTDTVSGVFAGLSEGAEILVGTTKYSISYKGGDGNDVELTMIDPNNFKVETAAELKNAIDTINSRSTGTGTAYSITVKAGSTLTEAATMAAIKLQGSGGNADSLIIYGNNSTLDGAGTFGGFTIASGNVEIASLAINNTMAQGSDGVRGDAVLGGGGGGGAGLGGGLYVSSAANVTLSNVSFSGNKAIGGDGGEGGFSDPFLKNSGYGGDLNGTISSGGAGTSSGNGSDGLFGGGGGGAGSSAGIGGAGGFGGGGGGGGASHTAGGAGGTGGFGAGSGETGVIDSGSGGGGGGGDPFDPFGGDPFGGDPFGGGGGAGGLTTGAGGGGGLGAGGAIFIGSGANLTITGGTLGAGTVTGGTGGSAGAGNGSAYGSSIFIGGEQTLNLGAAGQTTTVTGVIADMKGSGGTGVGALSINGGIVLLNGVNTYTGGTTIASGATLGGSGTVGDVTVSSGGTLAAGNGTGIFHTGDLDLKGGSLLAVEINGTAAGTGYDQVDVDGSVTLSGHLDAAVLDSFVPGVGSTYTVIDNDGADSVSGTFTGLSEGASLIAGTDVFTISYLGGDGNDVVLTASSPINTTSTTGMTITGTFNASNTIVGTAGDDDLTGGSLNDTLTGGLGKDELTGGRGNDVFAFNSATDSADASTRDVITDFLANADRIDVSGIDADSSLGGNQAFSFVGTAAFSGQAGQLRYEHFAVDGRTIVYGDVDGDQMADFQIELTGLKTLLAAEFVL
jgi:ribosomal 50S subunit-recycling heat shock protein